MNERQVPTGTPPTDSEIVAAFQARELAEEVRERAITSLRWACDGDDYDLLMAAGDLGGAELDAWKDGL